MSNKATQKKMSWAELYGAPTVTISEAKQIMMLSWADSRPVVLVGPPGIGKTQAMMQVAREYQAENGISKDEFGTVYVMMSHVDREFLTGLVYFDGTDSNTFRHMHHEQFLQELGKPHGVIIFDEFNRPRDVGILNAFFAWVTERGANGLQLNPGWSIIAAINPSSGDYMVSQVERDGAVRRRLCWIEVAHNASETITYMTQNTRPDMFHPEVVRFLRENPAHCFDETALDSGKIGTTPASWQDVSRKIYRNEQRAKEGLQALSASLLEMAIAGHIGVGVASAFMASYQRQLDEELPTAFDILRSMKTDKKMAALLNSKITLSSVGVADAAQEPSENADEDDEALEKSEGAGDTKGWVLHIIEALVNVVAMTPYEEFVKELDPEKMKNKPADTASSAEKSQFICKQIAPNLSEFLVMLPPDLFSMWTAKISEVGKSSRESRERLITVGAELSKQPGFTKATAANRRIVNK